VPKILVISERCELVQLCDIYCSGPVFFEIHWIYVYINIHIYIQNIYIIL